MNSPEKAISKNATVNKISNTPGNPEEIVTPITIAATIVIMVSPITREISVSNLPSRIASLDDWVRRVFERNPEFMSFTIDTPLCGEVIRAQKIKIPGVRYAT